MPHTPHTREQGALRQIFLQTHIARWPLSFRVGGIPFGDVAFFRTSAIGIRDRVSLSLSLSLGDRRKFPYKLRRDTGIIDKTSPRLRT